SPGTHPTASTMDRPTRSEPPAPTSWPPPTPQPRTVRPQASRTSSSATSRLDQQATRSGPRAGSLNESLKNRKHSGQCCDRWLPGVAGDGVADGGHDLDAVLAGGGNVAAYA